MTNLNIDIIREYEAVFGSQKMQQLWHEFETQAVDYLSQADTKKYNIEELRLRFHSLRSSALVFGMEAFSVQCSKLEEAIVNGAKLPEIAQDIHNATIIFDQQRHFVSAYLK